MKLVTEVINNLSQEELAQFEKEGTFSILNTPYSILLSDVEIIAEDIPGWQVTNMGNLTVALDINTGRPWPWHFKAGRQWTPAAPTLVADNADMEMGAALAGIAFAQLADYMAAPYIASGKLVRVLESEEPPAWGLYVYRPQRGPIPGRVRAVFDEMLVAVGSLPALR